MEPTGCGCPPTTPIVTGPGRVHHVFLNVPNLEQSRSFYDWLMPQLGYPVAWSTHPGVAGWLSPAGSVWMKQQALPFTDATFHKDRVGLAEIAFAPSSREEGDALAASLLARGATILDPPREYPAYVPGYYAVFFADPDGIKLEFVYIPQ